MPEPAPLAPVPASSAPVGAVHGHPITCPVPRPGRPFFGNRGTPSGFGSMDGPIPSARPVVHSSTTPHPPLRMTPPSRPRHSDRSRERTPRRSRAPADSRPGGRRRPAPPVQQRPVWQGGAATGTAETSSGRPVFHGVPSTPNGRRRRRPSDRGARSPLTISVPRGSGPESNGAPSLSSAASTTSLSHRLPPGLVLHGLTNQPSVVAVQRLYDTLASRSATLRSLPPCFTMRPLGGGSAVVMRAAFVDREVIDQVLQEIGALVGSPDFGTVEIRAAQPLPQALLN